MSPPCGGGVPKGRGGDLKITTPTPSLSRKGIEKFSLHFFLSYI